MYELMRLLITSKRVMQSFLFSETSPKPVLLPVYYGWKKMTTVREMGALLMEDFKQRNCGIINKADGMNLAQVRILLIL